MGISLLTKVPWRKVIKVIGVTSMGVASVMGAMESDEKVQKVIKKLATKAINKN